MYIRTLIFVTQIPAKKTEKEKSVIMRTIFHLDLDTFFISVERILDPSLKGIPVIVGANPNGRGVVSACSYEARTFGLHSGMPIRQAYQLCPKGTYLRGHFEEYERYSRLVRALLTKYAPEIEQASIDEFYMDFTGCNKIYGDFFLFAKYLQNLISEHLLLPASIGIGSNKNIAKIASDYNKPFGITFVPHGNEKKFLSPLPVEKIPGVGKVTVVQLNAKGIYTIGDLAALPVDYITAAYGKNGLNLWNKANGRGVEYLTPSHNQKNISKEKTLKEDVTKISIIEKVLFELTGKVCQLLRNEKWFASTISIKLRYSDFRTLTRAKTIIPTDDDKQIYSTAVALLTNIPKRRIAFRLIGIHLSNFIPASKQEFLFDFEELKRKRMLEAINNIRTKYGYKVITLGDVCA